MPSDLFSINKSTLNKNTNIQTLKTTITGVITGALMMLATQAGDKVQLEGAKVGHWTIGYAAVVKLASEKNLPLMLNFTGSDWCG